MRVLLILDFARLVRIGNGAIDARRNDSARDVVHEDIWYDRFTLVQLYVQPFLFCT